MNEKSCAASDGIHRWKDIDIETARKNVKKLQRRIAEAYAHRCFDKSAYLQNVLIHSLCARVLAVDVVSRSRGCNTVGVDGKTLDDVLYLIFDNNLRRYKPQPLKRIYIPKGDGKVRPISIPTVEDRVMQTLYKFALEPIAELTADDCSFGFRPRRSSRDALVRCGEILSHNPKMKWVLKADIKSCFDSINHQWIMDNIPINKSALRKFLKCGYVEKLNYYEMERGVPQGGCLSAIICNMTLDGLEDILYENFPNEVDVVRYADDIVIFGTDKPLLVRTVVPLIESFLRVRGLELSKEKTKLACVDDGFSFLGWRVYKSDERVYLIPTDKNITSLLEKIGKILKGDFTLSYKVTCKKLNALIRGWFNYYVNIAVKQSLYGVEYEVCRLVHDLTADKRVVDFVQNLFKDLDKKYTN